MYQANTPRRIQESSSFTLLLLFLFLGGAKKAALTKHQVTYCMWSYFKIWITKFHGTRNVNFTFNSYSRSSLLHSAPCAGTICSSHLFNLWPQQNWMFRWRPEEGTFYFIQSRKQFSYELKDIRDHFCSQCMFILKSPGPAAYQVVDPCVYKHKPPQYSIYGRNFTPGERTQKPGPGAHFPEKVLILFYFNHHKGNKCFASCPFTYISVFPV